MSPLPAVAALQQPPGQLDAAGYGERGRECQHQPPRALERSAAVVPKQSRIGSPTKRRHGIEENEAAPGIPHGARAEGDGGAPAGDEPRHGDQLASTLLKLLVGPVDAALGAFAAEEALDRAFTEPAADQIGAVVAEKRSAAAEAMTTGRLRSPAPATTPAVITAVSLGRMGTSASRNASRKTIAYAHPEASATSCVN